jgi:hypothetical protein
MADAAVADPVDIRASDVTGMYQVELEGIDGHRLAGEVARSVAQTLDLPDDLSWTLRDSATARMLDDELALGAQVQSGVEVTVIPKVHLA